MWGVMKQKYEGLFCLEAAGYKNGVEYCLMILEFNSAELTISLGNSGLGRCWKSSPRGSKLKGD